MTPARLIVFRIFLMIFGRLPFVGWWLHRLLVRILVKGRGRPYGASGRFYTPEDLR